VGGVQKHHFWGFVAQKSWIVHQVFFAFFAGGGLTAAALLVTLLGVAALVVTLGFAVFTDLGPFFFGVATFLGVAVFLTVGAFLAGGATGFVTGTTFSSADFLLAAAGGAALLGLAALVSSLDALAGDFGALTGLAAFGVAPLGAALLFFTRPAAGPFFLATLVGLGAAALIAFGASLLATTDLGALMGFFKSSESLKEFLTL